ERACGVIAMSAGNHAQAAGEDTIRGVQKFILSPGGTLGIGSQYGIVALSDPKPDSGNVQVDSLRSFSPQANYVFNGVVPQVTGSGLPTTVNDLTIDDTAGVTLSHATIINGTLHLIAGTFDNTIPFTLGPNGKISNEGGKVLVPTAVNSVVPSVPKQFSLDQNYPNPFNPTTEIQFGVPKNAYVTLTIYNGLGQKVATLVDGNLTAGVYHRVFDGSRYASGMYIARLVSGNHVMTAKMLMIK
ncbi:MAG TPA: T9SS type A sorting domain-containing protein, partial [Candidatus Kryptobacter bacterium]|nr:T9SS type A sorting domain-containing protein [Candidatus Kryptobacter bacterium]